MILHNPKALTKKQSLKHSNLNFSRTCKLVHETNSKTITIPFQKAVNIAKNFIYGNKVVFTASNAFLSYFSQVQLTDSGMFTCLAWNSLGSEASSAELRVIEIAPTFQKHPVMPNEGMIGGSAVMECQPEGAPQLTLQWLHNGAALTTGISQLDPETGTATVCCW